MIKPDQTVKHYQLASGHDAFAVRIGAKVYLRWPLAPSAERYADELISSCGWRRLNPAKPVEATTCRVGDDIVTFSQLEIIPNDGDAP
jgi:hypothetical protein